ncbi:ankyrin repeat-containing protein [Anopheles sinensis]|uniref:Ankyrin repeat-containing protein n=1 Tax=Anopheles sinensis TaxID=74873 RepID=A0A084V9Z8_ANOSI|nr:ankyrin repeat-containing protein [Anopheles sinensis]
MTPSNNGGRRSGGLGVVMAKLWIEFNEDAHSNEHTNHRFCTFLPATITDDDNEHISHRFCTFLLATIADRNVTTEPGGSPL